MTSKAPWTPSENAALARLYFAMLDKATTGRPYNKAAMIRHAQTGDEMPSTVGPRPGPLQLRSRGSIEAKLMNATAAHLDLLRRNGAEAGGADARALTMDGHGYRALSNYQAALKDAIGEEMHRRAMAEFHAERSA